MLFHINCTCMALLRYVSFSCALAIYSFCSKALSHNSHVYGFSPLWVLMCILRSEARMNAAWYELHSCGLSPVCILLCTSRLSFCPIALLQQSHLYSLSPGRIKCLLREALPAYSLRHILHKVRLFSTLDPRIYVKCLLLPNRFVTHAGFSPAWVFVIMVFEFIFLYKCFLTSRAFERLVFYSVPFQVSLH